ncbi:aldehyde dehydrogenase (NADP(+)) [Mycobacterium sp. 21AC1]|uniref:aldehyde dehydrogenase (NADP(+)) n=1 Tax=[Mycobacterium] appelbergii TaxID=2939269 RepID=UPI002938D5F5|nr:aldehyde dehydrogenase (NADP(+)) [Mycobacterium sp. 21AC1]MDV3127239.1 aldehyde dehydrogenase (NADP(+)) [Mycobacterium sp. 21AC1]
MTLTGQMFIAGDRVDGAADALYPIAAVDGRRLTPAYGAARDADIDVAACAAREAFDPYRAQPLEVRARLLERIADGLERLGDELLERAHQETALPMGRLVSERGRTAGQLRMFADHVREGDWLGVRIAPADTDRQPLPRPDLRLQHIPVGPVAVFGASNFPFAFSVAGGDTASALAAGCPVIAKGHEAHLGTSELVGGVITEAVRAEGLPAGVFSLLFGAGPDVGQALVRHPAVAAVGFTGSRRAGLALTATAAQRPVPIPVYAEMSSVNPVVLAGGALAENADQLAAGFTASLTLGAGQFCTNPGLVFVVGSPDADRFVRTAVTLLEATDPQTMLTPAIADGYRRGLDRLRAQPGVRERTAGAAAGNHQAVAALFSVAAEDFLRNPVLHEEIFGPAGLVVELESPHLLTAALRALPGQLTVTVHATEDDDEFVGDLLPQLEQLAGRIVFGGWPTGVEVGDAMVHGGPFPATSDARSTSVGTLAIERFLRPVAYQDMPAALQPPAVRDENPLNLVRRIDGTPALPPR